LASAAAGRRLVGSGQGPAGEALGAAEPPVLPLPVLDLEHLLQAAAQVTGAPSDLSLGRLELQQLSFRCRQVLA